jgi:hypothetical protein
MRSGGMMDLGSGGRKLVDLIDPQPRHLTDEHLLLVLRQTAPHMTGRIAALEAKIASDAVRRMPPR